MSETTEGTEGQQPTGQQGKQNDEGGKSGFTPPATQDELNKIIDDRLKRERAKYSDYDDLKQQAAELAKLKDADKTEAQKLNERLTVAEATAAQVPMMVASGLREHLVKLHKIEADDAELFLTGDTPELLLKQVDRLLARGQEQADARKKQGLHAPREGTPTGPGNNPELDFVRDLFAGTG